MFGITPDYALHNMSYVNVIMYSRAIPMPGDNNDKPNDDAPLFDESKDACNDIDLTETDEEIIVKR